MAASIPVSAHGLKTIDGCRKLKGWKKLDEDWAELAGVSTTTLRRFWEGRCIRQPHFKSICQAVGVENWEALVDQEALICSSSEKPLDKTDGSASPFEGRGKRLTAQKCDRPLYQLAFPMSHLEPPQPSTIKVFPYIPPLNSGARGVRGSQLENSCQTQTQLVLLDASDRHVQKAFTARPVALDSPFYVDRPPIESDCYNEIREPGALIRIKALRQMGKTSLMNRILAQAALENYQTVRLNLRQAERSVLSNIDKFLRWFCANVTQQLQLEPRLDDYWDEELMGSLVSCTTYFQAYLLEQINRPLVLALDDVEHIFEYPDIAQDFFPLLRNWYEEANNLDIWKLLRVLVVHSTEVYIPLKINQSPFNVGLPVELPEFGSEQVADLARRHGLDWTENQLKPLMAMIGGHPFLVRLALYRISRQAIALDHLLQTAPTESGIFIDHLRRHLVSLQQNPELAAAFKKVVTTDESVQLEPMRVYQLQRMGLVQLDGNKVMPRCNLYRQYFRNSICSEACVL